MSERNRKIVEKLNFFVAYLLIYFLFFGFICNTGDLRDLKEPGDKLLYVFTNFYSMEGWNWAGLYPPEWMEWIETIPGFLSIFIFIFIGVIQAYREDFLFHAIRNSIFMPFLVILTSWMWYTINYSIPGITTYLPAPDDTIPVNFLTVIARYFVSDGQFQWFSILNFVILEVLYVGAGFLGGWLKIYRNRKKLVVLVE
jgi:hypothetical protein